MDLGDIFREPHNQIPTYLSKLRKPYHLVSLKKNSFLDEDFQKKSFSIPNIKKIQKSQAFLVIDNIDEGYCPIEHRIFDFIYHLLDCSQISPKNVIYLSSNLLDQNNLRTFLSVTRRDSLHLICFNFHQLAFQRQLDMMQENKWPDFKEHLAFIQKETKNNFRNNFFLSLSRHYRDSRAYATFLLCTSKIRKNGLISHDVLPNQNLVEFIPNHLKKKFKKWAKTLPLIIDLPFSESNEFVSIVEHSNINLFTQTLFQIVNESVADYPDRSLYYTEKTFKSMYYLQPLIIFGSKGLNSYLDKIGFKNYSAYFEISRFDHINDSILRYQMILQVVHEIIDNFSKLSPKSQLEWRFSQQELLQHNYEFLLQPGYEKEFLSEAIEEINQTC